MDYNEEEPILVAYQDWLCMQSYMHSQSKEEGKVNIQDSCFFSRPWKESFGIWHHLIMESKPQWLYNDT